MGYGGKREGFQDCGTDAHPWLIHVDVWQKKKKTQNTKHWNIVIRIQLK